MDEKNVKDELIKMLEQSIARTIGDFLIQNANIEALQKRKEELKKMQIAKGETFKEELDNIDKQITSLELNYDNLASQIETYNDLIDIVEKEGIAALLNQIVDHKKK